MLSLIRHGECSGRVMSACGREAVCYFRFDALGASEVFVFLLAVSQSACVRQHRMHIGVEMPESICMPVAED